MTEYREVRTTERVAGQEQRVATFKVTQLIWLVFGLISAAIALRVLFKLIAVNPANPFAALLYSITGLLVAPFASLTSAPSAGGMVLEISSIIAIVVYLLVAWALERIVYVLFYRPRGPVSVQQTVFADRAVQTEPVGVHRTLTTERSTTRTPTGETQTTVTERTDDPRSS